MNSQFKQCGLCESDITNFHPLLNHLKIDEDHEYDICKKCFDKIMNWQREVFTTLFPRKQRHGRQKS